MCNFNKKKKKGIEVANFDIHPAQRSRIKTQMEMGLRSM